MNMPVRAIPINAICAARPLPAHKRRRSRCIIQYGTLSIKWMMTVEKRTLFNNGDLCILILGRWAARPRITLWEILQWNFIIRIWIDGNRICHIKIYVMSYKLVYIDITEVWFQIVQHFIHTKVVLSPRFNFCWFTSLIPRTSMIL